MEENKYIKDRVLRLIETGEYIAGAAPFGYKRHRDLKIVIDEQKSFLVPIIFDLYNTRSFSIAELSRHLEEKYNIWCSKNTILIMLRNPFYYGVQRFKKNFYPHKFPTLITKEVFDKAQLIRLNSGFRSNKMVAHSFLYRTLIKCKECQCIISPTISHKKYIFYNCVYKFDRTIHRPMKEVEITNLFEEMFKKIDRRLVPLFENYNLNEKRLMLQFMFKHFEYSYESNTFQYELAIPEKNICDQIKEYIDTTYAIMRESEAKRKNAKTYEDPLLQFCIEAKSIEDIMQQFGLPLEHTQMRLVDLELEDKILQTDEGLWESI